MSDNKRIECADGFSMSVQAGICNYCEPRVDNANEYTAVEVGYPSDYEPMLATWAENPDKYTRTVYPFVPVQVIVDVCAKHGGIVAGDLPPGVIYLRKA